MEKILVSSEVGEEDVEGKMPLCLHLKRREEPNNSVIRYHL